MAEVELILPKMGESIIEATIISWFKSVGEHVDEDETILEVATDKVDSEIPSPVSGTITKILFQPDDVVQIGTPIAIIATEGSAPVAAKPPEKPQPAPPIQQAPAKQQPAPTTAKKRTLPRVQPKSDVQEDEVRFYSPLVRNIARAEGISREELALISGSGASGRVTKNDLLAFVDQKKIGRITVAESRPAEVVAPQKETAGATSTRSQTPVTSFTGNADIQKMDRMRQLIADHMVNSKRVAPHVTSFVEADVTNMVLWRNREKEPFAKKHGERLTYSPLFVEAVISALNDFPMINSSLDGTNIIVKKDYNLGIATALPNGNLIVPVIKRAQDLSLIGLTAQLNDVTARARSKQLKPEDVQGGTFTISNIGTFGNIMGTPIINQPQVAILAIGSINKKPVVVESPEGDAIGIRHMMFLSLSYDHRIIDGFLGGSFLKRIADNIEAFDSNRKI